MYLSGHFTVAEQIEAVIAAIGEKNAELSAFVSVADERALRRARAADRLIASLGETAFGQWPLLGIAVSVKDLIQTRDLPTTRGSLLPNRRAPGDAPIVARLRAAGAIVVGKTTTSEYGWCASSVSRAADVTRNPWDLARSSGGSSGGCAAAVSAGLVVASVGTDGAGSIRIPSAFCGVVGFKPSFGCNPYVPPSVERLAHTGPLARSVADIVELMAVLPGPDFRDPYSTIRNHVPAGRPVPLRIGWIEFPGTSSEIRAVTEAVLPVLTGLGHRVDRIEIPFADPYEALVDLLAAAEASGTPPEDDPWVDQGRLAVVRYGRTLPGMAVMRAEEVRVALRTRLDQVMGTYDLLVMATVPDEPFAAEAIAPPWAANPEDLLWLAWSPASYPFNLTGQPALSLPVGMTSAGFPVGLQLVGRLGADELVLGTGQYIEAELGLALMPPS